MRLSASATVFVGGLAALLMLLAASKNVAAQTADTYSETAPLQPPYPSTVTPPVDIGRHVCVGMFYPAAAIKARAQGTTVLSFEVTTAGAVHNIKVVTSSGNMALDNASIECVLPWQFQPAIQNGKPIPVIKEVAQVWKLSY